MGRLTSNRNEYQEHFLGIKGVRLTNLPPSCAVVMKSGNLNLLTPNVNYSGRTAPLASKVAFYIFIQQI